MPLLAPQCLSGWLACQIVRTIIMVKRNVGNSSHITNHQYHLKETIGRVPNAEPCMLKKKKCCKSRSQLSKIQWPSNIRPCSPGTKAEQNGNFKLARDMIHIPCFTTTSWRCQGWLVKGWLRMVTDGQGLLGFRVSGQFQGIREVNVQTVNMKCKWQVFPFPFPMFSRNRPMHSPRKSSMWIQACKHLRLRIVIAASYLRHARSRQVEVNSKQVTTELI